MQTDVGFFLRLGWQHLRRAQRRTQTGFRKLYDMSKTQAAKLLRQQLAVLHDDVLSFAIPEGLKDSDVMRRARGDKSDIECVNEICGLIAEGMIVTKAVKTAKVPWPTWHAWVQLNHCRAKDRYEVAYQMHLEAMADRTHTLIEEMEAERKTCMDRFHAEYESWRAGDDKARPPPIYKGPGGPANECLHRQANRVARSRACRRRSAT